MRRLFERRTRAGLGATFIALGLVACAPGPGDTDGGPGMDVPTVEGGTIRPDASLDDAAYDGGGDAGARCSGTCDPRVERSCPGTAVCALGSGIPACAASVGAAAEGTACEATDGCARGLGCFRDRETGLGVCRRVCCPLDGLGCRAGEVCGGSGELLGGARTDWGECGAPRTCDVLAPDACTAREGCYIVDASGTTECRIAGSAEAGAPCTLPEDCAAGLFCGGLGGGTCLVICGLGSARPCPDGMRCVAQSYSPAGSGVCVRDMLAP